MGKHNTHNHARYVPDEATDQDAQQEAADRAADDGAEYGGRHAARHRRHDGADVGRRDRRLGRRRVGSERRHRRRLARLEDRQAHVVADALLDAELALERAARLRLDRADERSVTRLYGDRRRRHLARRAAETRALAVAHIALIAQAAVQALWIAVVLLRFAHRAGVACEIDGVICEDKKNQKKKKKSQENK